MMSNLKIAVKIGCAFALMAAVGIAGAAVSWQNFVTIERTSFWTDHTRKVLSEVDRITAAMLNRETGLRGYLIAGDPEFLAPYRAGAASYAEAIAAARTLTADNPAQQERLSALDALAARWRAEVAEREIALMKDAATQAEARRIEASGAGRSVMDALRAKAAEIAGAETVLLGARAAEAAAAGEAYRIASVAGLAAMLVMACLGLAGLQFGVVRPIRRMTAVMGRLAGGDLGAEVAGRGRRDEIGAMAGAVQVFKENLLRTQALEREAALGRAGIEAQRKAAMRDLADRFEAAVGGIVSAVGSAATELQTTARSMSATAAETASQSSTVAAAAEEASANVTMVASSAEELGSSVTEIGRQVEGSTALAGAVAAEATQTASLVRDLSRSAETIGNVVGLISTIASQTNLLALNATIEAARAGAAGRGFAVVAAEVKELAGQTAKATDEIARQIGGIQAATGQAVGAIDSITTRVHELSAVSASIAAAVEEQGSATQEIVRNVSQAAVGTGEVTATIAGVAGASEATGAAASQVLVQASELSRRSEQLGAEVDRFLATVRAA
ncbi:methyl-accepting chemotaxis protein [Methylobacterium crusticola]|nr:CHASE3 domain-containing protein [Methylobacterium crusticola]